MSVDPYRSPAAVESAIKTAAQKAASIDLGDHFRFVYTRHQPTIGGQRQPYTEGYRVTFDSYVGTAKRNPINVDLVVKVVTTGKPEIQPLRSDLNRLDLVQFTADRIQLNLEVIVGLQVDPELRTHSKEAP